MRKQEVVCREKSEKRKAGRERDDDGGRGGLNSNLSSFDWIQTPTSTYTPLLSVRPHPRQRKARESGEQVNRRRFFLFLLSRKKSNGSVSTSLPPSLISPAFGPFQSAGRPPLFSLPPFLSKRTNRRKALSSDLSTKRRRREERNGIVAGASSNGGRGDEGNEQAGGYSAGEGGEDAGIEMREGGGKRERKRRMTTGRAGEGRYRAGGGEEGRGGRKGGCRRRYRKGERGKLSTKRGKGKGRKERKETDHHHTPLPPLPC